MNETVATCVAYISRCRSLSQRLHSNNFPDSIRADAIKDVCEKFESFNEFPDRMPKAFARLFIMHLADFDYHNDHFEKDIPAAELNKIYLEWHPGHMEEDPAN